MLRADGANLRVGVRGPRADHAPSRTPDVECGLLPAADDGLAGQRQVQEGLPQLEGQRVLQRLTVDDQRQLVLLLQGVAQGGAVLRQLGPGRLQGLLYFRLD